MFTEFDRLAMTRALALAERGLETTHPNPRVGCVIAKGDRIIGEGWHERAGEAHAEVAAIRSAKEPVAGATAYVTLEPCSHHGRTPPCVNALIDARIARVVFAVQDPNPRVSGQGADALLRAGITVEAGLMQAEATELNIGFMKRMREGLPWVRVKLAMSLDGRTALANGQSQWITSEPARNDVQRWRARCSAVMTGVGTVLADDPQLNVRVAGFKGRQPLRVVLDARLRSPVGAKMFVGMGGGGAGVAAGSAAVAPAGGTGAALAGDVLIFTAIGGGVSAAGPARPGSAASGTSALAGDMAELVSAFETSPTAVAARSAELAGPVSVKTEVPSPDAAASGAAAGVHGPSTRAGVGAGAAAGGAGGAAGGAGGVAGGAAAGVGAALGVRAGDAGVSGAGPRASVAGAGAPLTSGAAGAAVSSVPPTLAAAAAVSGVPTSADDATWAGAALSGAIPVGSDAKAPSAVSGPATDGRPPANAGTGVTAATGAAPAGGTASAGNPIPPVAGAPGPRGASAQANTAAAPAPASTSTRMGATAATGSSASAAVSPPAGMPNPAGAAAPVSTSTPAGLAAPVGTSASAGASAPAGTSAPAGVSASAGVSATMGTSAPTGVAARAGAASLQASAAASPVSASPSGPGAAVPGPAVAPAAGVAATGSGETKGATSAVAGAAPRSGEGAASKAAPKADTPAAFQARRAALLARGVRIEEVAADDGFLDLFAVLKKLAELEVNEVLVEAGPTLAGQLLTTFFVDELLLYIAPKLLGPQGRPLVNLPELQSLQDAWGFALFDAKRFGDDLRLRMRPK